MINLPRPRTARRVTNHARLTPPQATNTATAEASHQRHNVQIIPSAHSTSVSQNTTAAIHHTKPNKKYRLNGNMRHPTPYPDTNKPPHQPHPQTARQGATITDQAATIYTHSTGAPQHTMIASRGCTGDDRELKGCQGTRAQRVASNREQDTMGERGRKLRWGPSDIDPPHLWSFIFKQTDQAVQRVST